MQKKKNHTDDQSQAEATMRAILKTTADGIVTIDAKGIIESFNPAAEKIFGYDADEVVGQNVTLLMPEPYHSTHDEHVEDYLKTDQAKIIGYGREVVGQRKNGTIFPLDLAVSEFFLGDDRYFTGIVRDVTERKRLEEQLTQSAKLAALGELVGGIAHEVNNPIGIIMMRVSSLMESAKVQECSGDVLDDIEVIQRQSDRVAQITSGLLAFSRQSPFAPHASDLNVTVSNAVTLVENVLRSRGIDLCRELADDLPSVFLDSPRIEQVLLNLFNNAMDAMPNGGTLRITTGSVADHTGKRWVQMGVKDSGVGIKKEDLDRLFNPFFTTKEVGKGTGLGLSISYGIVQEHGGQIKVDSQLGDGAEFQIWLPLGKDGEV